MYLTNTKELCYNRITNKSSYHALSSDRNSFGISLLLYLPSNATQHPLCRFDEEPGLRQRCSATACRDRTARITLTYCTERVHLYVNRSKQVN